jgi:hypothetical protein
VGAILTLHPILFLSFLLRFWFEGLFTCVAKLWKFYFFDFYFNNSRDEMSYWDMKEFKFMAKALNDTENVVLWRKNTKSVGICIRSL